MDPAADQQRLEAENQRLRTQLIAAQLTSDRALSRATRLARVVSVMGDLSDLDDLASRAAGEVAELFACDIGIFWLSQDGRCRLAAHWGVPVAELPAQAAQPPLEAQEAPQLRLSGTGLPVLAGPVGQVVIPDWLERYALRHVGWVQLAIADACLGWLFLGRRLDEPFDHGDLFELRAVAGRIAVAVDRWRLGQRTGVQSRRMQRLQRLTAQLAGMLDVAQMGRALTAAVVKEVPVSGVAVYLNDNARHWLLSSAGLVDGPDGQRIRLPMIAGDQRTGTLMVVDPPASGHEDFALLQHLADLGGLALQKALGGEPPFGGPAPHGTATSLVAQPQRGGPGPH